MEVLNNKKIDQIIRRIAIQIIEENWMELKDVVLIGLNNAGFALGHLIKKEIEAWKNGEIQIPIENLKINPSNPLDEQAFVNKDPKLKNKNIIIVDDVANTGRSLFFAFKSIMKQLPKKVEVAVLVNRKHKQFPIFVNYKGIELSTTLQENIDVSLSQNNKKYAVLN